MAANRFIECKKVQKITIGIVFYGHPARFLSIPDTVIQTMICQQQGIMEHLVQDLNFGGITLPSSIQSVSNRSLDAFARQAVSGEVMDEYVRSPAPHTSIAIFSLTVAADLSCDADKRFYVAKSGTLCFGAKGDEPDNLVYVRGSYRLDALRLQSEADLLNWSVSCVADGIRELHDDEPISATADLENLLVSTDSGEEFLYDFSWMTCKHRLEFVGRVCAKLSDVELPIDLSSGYLFALPVPQNVMH